MSRQLTWQQKEDAVKEAAAAFPETFRLRAYPDGHFRIQARSSFYSDDSGVQLVIQRQTSEAERKKYGLVDEWSDFTRDTPAAIRAQVL